MCSVSQLSGSVPAPDSHSSRRSALPERGTPAVLVDHETQVTRNLLEAAAASYERVESRTKRQFVGGAAQAHG